jgi:hypothetical protein
VDDVAFAKVGEPRKGLYVDLVPQTDLVVDVLEYVTGYLVLRNSDEIALALQVALLADPDCLLSIFLGSGEVGQLGEVLKPHFFGSFHALLALVDVLHQRTLQV